MANEQILRWEHAEGLRFLRNSEDANEVHNERWKNGLRRGQTGRKDRLRSIL